MLPSTTSSVGPPKGLEPRHLHKHEAGKHKERTVQLQVTSRPAASPGLPPSCAWYAAPVRSCVLLRAGQVPLSARAHEPPTDPGQSD